MDRDDVVYLLLLLSSIGAGHFYRQIEGAGRRQAAGTLLGLAVVVAVSGVHVLHALVFVLVNALIILCADRRKCHLLSFAFSFSYLVFFRTTVYFGIPYPPAHTNLVIMMLTLKLVGLAFELNAAHARRDRHGADDELSAEYDCTHVDVGLADVVHYAFHYVGVLTGPYYSYRTYWDSLHLPFHQYANCKQITLDKLLWVPLYSALFLWATYTWPLSYALSEPFYESDSALYRAWYVVPVFFMFRMRIYIGLVLSECVCTMAGLGAYPTACSPAAGRGPTTNFQQLQQIGANPALARVQQYNFEAVHNIDVYGTEFGVTFRGAMKTWNMCIQYWMAVNVYKRFPSKRLRTLATLFVSAIWHGVYIGHYFCICGAPFHLPVEDIYVKLYWKHNSGKSKLVWGLIIWTIKMLSFSYLGFAFQLLTVERVLRYYNSIYQVGSVLGIVLYLVGLYLLKAHKRQDNADAQKRDEKIQ